MSINDNDDLIGDYYKYSKGLKLLNSKSTKEITIKWLYKTLEDQDDHPTFLISDLVSTLSLTNSEQSKRNLYIAYIPVPTQEPHFIGCFNINPEKRYLSIEQICTNPFIVDSSLTEFKKSLQILARNSHVLLYPQPLKYLINPRYFIEFSQSL
tara:strand:- start:1655 stop:2113 length:459 start_codon:yes stop_codon:yes gene_type:complete